MAKFLNTSATNYFLEEMIKSASDRLILISPFLKLNDRMKELLADVRIGVRLQLISRRYQYRSFLRIYLLACDYF
jgi:hypothetical protein